MEGMYVNVENLVREAHDQIDQIENDTVFIDACVNATEGVADPRKVVQRMLDQKIKPIVDGVVNRYLSVIAEAESRQNDSIH